MNAYNDTIHYNKFAIKYISLLCIVFDPVFVRFEQENVCYSRSLTEIIVIQVPLAYVLTVELQDTSCTPVHFLLTENINREKWVGWGKEVYLYNLIQNITVN